MSPALYAESTPVLTAQRGGLAPTAAPVKMHPSEIALTLSADVLRLPITMNARAVLAEIVSLHAANAGCCDASDAHFAARLTLSINTVSRAVQELETEGLVVKVTTRVPTGFYRTLTPSTSNIVAKAATNPYPQIGGRPTPKMRVPHPQNEGTPYPQFGDSPTPNLGCALPPNWGDNIPLNIPVENTTLNNDAACAAALGSEKKIGADFSSDALLAQAEVSAPPVAAAPPTKLHLMRLSAVASFPTFVEAWQEAAAANPEAYADFAQANLLHYHTALLDWSNANGKKKIDWLATIRASMRSDEAKGQLRKARPAGTSAESPVLKRLATAEEAFALNEYDEAGNRLN